MSPLTFVSPSSSINRLGDFKYPMSPVVKLSAANYQRSAVSKPTFNLVSMLGAGFVKLKELEFGQCVQRHALLILIRCLGL